MKAGPRALAEARGRRAEGLAALWLSLTGWRIVARRVRTRAGEIDLVARRGRVLAFVEVKARSDRTDAERLILAPAQRSRIVRAAASWAARRPWTQGLSWRFDAVILAPWRWPRHLADAWRPARDPGLEPARKPGQTGRHPSRTAP